MIAPTDSGSWITSLSTSASTFLETLRMSKRLSLDTAGTTAFAKWLFVNDFTPALLVRESIPVSSKKYLLSSMDCSPTLLPIRYFSTGYFVVS